MCFVVKNDIKKPENKVILVPTHDEILATVFECLCNFGRVKGRRVYRDVK